MFTLKKDKIGNEALNSFQKLVDLVRDTWLTLKQNLDSLVFYLPTWLCLRNFGANKTWLKTILDAYLTRLNILLGVG